MTIEPFKSRLFVVDAFTSHKYKNLKGNPAGVLITSQPLEDEQAAEIAKKLALPALALISDPNLFATPDSSSAAHADILVTWIGPTGYFMPLCGHATMATSLVLFDLFPTLQDIKFVSARSGQRIQARRTDHGAAIAFPCAPHMQEDLQLASRDDILNILVKASDLKKEDIVYIGENRQGDSVYLLVELKPSVYLKQLNINPNSLLELPHRGFWLSIPGPPDDPNIDMETRVFFPSVGIPEDQVCGSAHTLFTPYWASKRTEAMRTDADIQLTSRQVSPKGGLLGLSWNKKWGNEEGIVWLTGEGSIQDMGGLEA